MSSPSNYVHEQELTFGPYRLYRSQKLLLNADRQEPPHPGYGLYTTIAPGSFFTGVPYDGVGRYFKLGFRLKLVGQPPH